MRKTRIKQLRKEFEETIKHLNIEDQLKSSESYKKAWKLFKKEYRVSVSNYV
jgi:hypothetical protein